MNKNKLYYLTLLGLMPLSVMAANPSGTITMTPSTLAPGDYVLVEVATVKGTEPQSTGLTVKVDLSPLGRSVAQDLFDNGQYGDRVAGDGIFTYRENIASSLTTGQKTITATIRDNQARVATTSTSVTVGTTSGGGGGTTPTPTPTPLLIVGTASPTSVQQGASVLITGRVTPATVPNSTGITVRGDLRPIGGTSSMVFYDDGTNGDAVAGDNVFSLRRTISSTLSVGTKKIRLTARDAQARIQSYTLSFSVVAPLPSTNPSGLGSTQPNPVFAGQSGLVRVQVTPGTNPTSTGTTVTANLSSLGLSSSSVLRDDGTNGDSTANDNVFSLNVAIPSTLAAGTYSASAVIRDAQARQSQATWSTTVQVQPIEPQPQPDSTVCDAAYSQGFSLIEGKQVSTVPPLARPVKGVAFQDPTYRTCGVRITDHVVEPPSGFARNDYSRRQAFNIDKSYFIAYSLNGYWHLYNARTFQYVKQLPGLAGDAEPQWHPTNPELLYYLPNYGGMVINQLNVNSGVITEAASFTGKLPWADVARAWTRSEGSPSANGRYWCLMAETSNFTTRGVFVYDLQTQQVVGTRSYSVRPDHLSMSPSGRWCVVSDFGSNGGTIAWSRDFTTSRVVHGTTEHSDIALNKNGEDVYVAVDYQSNAGDFFMFNIDTNTRTALFPTYVNGAATAYHVSGKAFGKPGWVLVSTYAGSGTNNWMMNKLFWVELVPNPRILNVGHHYSQLNGYFTEPHASVSRDGSRVVWSSNWGTTSSEDIDAYMYILKPEWIP